MYKYLSYLCRRLTYKMLEYIRILKLNFLNGIIWKKWLVFGSGVLSGSILTFLALLITSLASQNNSGLIGATYFDQPTEEIDVDSFEVEKVIQDNAALVSSRSFQTYGTYYLLVNNSEHYYYNDEKINVSDKQKIMHIGMYKCRYIGERIVPIIEIVDK